MDSQSIEEDHHPEVVNAGKANKRVERLRLKQELSTPQERRRYFGDLSNEEYKKVLGYINSLSRAQPIDYEYKNGQLPLEPTPPFQDKERLMNITFQAVRNILSSTDLVDTKALRTAALTLAGAIDYIHPYENGNGRTGRVAHYLIEFGTQRGPEAFESELYAVIGKLPMYDTDRAKAFDDGPPPEMGQELNRYVNEHFKESIQDPTTGVSKRVEVFLDMMQGKVNIPIDIEVPLRNFSLSQKDSAVVLEKIEAGSINGPDLYEKQYLYYSSIPNRTANEVPVGAKRVMGVQKSANGPKIAINFDLI